MKRFVLAVAVLAGLAGCGPDCDKFCKHWVGDCGTALNLTVTDLPTSLARCVDGCNQVGGDYAAFIGCATDKKCDELAAGACQIPAALPGFTK